MGPAASPPPTPLTPPTQFSYWWVNRLQDVLMNTIRAHGIPKYGLTEDVGIWVGDDLDRKVAALGLQLRQGCSMHGFALNVNPDLTFYDGIVPCGLKDKGVTSIAREVARPDLTVDDVIPTVVREFEEVFQATVVNQPPEAPAAA